MDDLISEFISETGESLAVLDRELVKLERNPADQEILGTIYRLVHTIKSTCGFLALHRLEALAEAVEQVLASVQDGTCIMTQSTSFVLLEALAAIRRIVTHLAEHTTEPDGNDAIIIGRLARIVRHEAAVEEALPATQEPASVMADTPASIVNAPTHATSEHVALPPLAMSHPLPTAHATSIAPEHAPVTMEEKPLEPSTISREMLTTIASALTEVIHARNTLRHMVTPSQPMLQLNAAVRALQSVITTAAQHTHASPVLNVQSVVVAYAAGQPLALSQQHMVEIIDLATDTSVRVAQIHHTDVLIKDRRVMPLVKLRTLLNLSDFPSMREDQVVVMRVGTAEFALVVERVSELTEVIVEALPRLLRHVPLFQGAVWHESRMPMLVMDSVAIARAIGFRQLETRQLATTVAPATSRPLKGFLLVRAGAGAPKALLVDDVVRIDGMHARAMDIRMATVPGATSPALGEGEVVVVRTHGEPLALAVDKVLDVLHAPYEVNEPVSDAPYLGTVELAGMKAQLINVEHFLHAMDGGIA